MIPSIFANILPLKNPLTHVLQRMTPDQIDTWASNLTSWTTYAGLAAAVLGAGALFFTNADSKNKKKELEDYKEKRRRPPLLRMREPSRLNSSTKG